MVLTYQRVLIEFVLGADLVDLACFVNQWPKGQPAGRLDVFSIIKCTTSAQSLQIEKKVELLVGFESLHDENITW